MKRTVMKLLSVILAVTLLSACAPERSGIAYTVYPVGFLVERMTGGSIPSESIQEDVIVQRATIREDWEEVLSSAAVFLHIGQLDPYYAMYSRDYASLVPDLIDLSVMNAVYDFRRYTEVNSDGEITFIESPYYRGEEFDLIDTDSRDLYLWMDPIAMLSMARDVRDWLISAYPDEQAAFESNFELLENDLINLDAQYQALATSNEVNERQIKFVTMTASFGNWQKTYGFQVYPVILSKYGALPNEAQLELIEKRIKDDDVQYIVYESNMTQDMISLFNRIEDDLSLTRVELSNLSSLTEADKEAGKDYLSIMYENLAVLETMAADRTELPEISEEDPEGDANVISELPEPEEVEQALTWEEAYSTPSPEEENTDKG